MAGPTILTNFSSPDETTTTTNTHTHTQTQKEVIIIKLGGSSITDKTKYETLKTEGLAAAAALVAKCHEQGLGVIVVHGAGSFGHPQAKKYQINKGWKQPSETDTHTHTHTHTQPPAQGEGGGEEKTEKEAFEWVRYGFAATRCSVLKLSNIILSELVSRGLPATSISACGVWHTHGGQVVKNNTAAVTELLSLGFIPIMHGDGVLDDTKGCSVLSGDTIIRELARDVPGVRRVIFLTDVDGVYTHTPTHPSSSLLPLLLVNDQGKLTSALSTQGEEGEKAKGDDVTGGMELKLATAIEIQVDHKGKVPVFISKVGSEASVSACIKGDVGDRATKLCHV